MPTTNVYIYINVCTHRCTHAFSNCNCHPNISQTPSVHRDCCLMWTYALRGQQSFTTSKQTYCALQQLLVYNGPCERRGLLSVVAEFMGHLWFSSLIHCEILALMLLASNAPAPEVPLRMWVDDSTPDKDSLSAPTHTHRHRKAVCYINHHKCDSKGFRQSSVCFCFFSFVLAEMRLACKMQILAEGRKKILTLFLM